MQCLEVSGAVRPIHGSLGVKRLNTFPVLVVFVLRGWAVSTLAITYYFLYFTIS